MSNEGTIKLLWDCANALQINPEDSAPAIYVKRLLKSHYVSTCHKLSLNSIQTPKEKFAVSQMCPRCLCFWSDNDFQLKLRPQLIKSSKAKRLIAKLEESRTSVQKGLLTKKQRRRAKWLQKRVNSNIEIHCKFCKKKSAVPLEKPRNRGRKTAPRAEPTELDIAEPKKAKKKKKKDRTAGLKVTALPKSAAISSALGEKKKKAFENKLNSKPSKLAKCPPKIATGINVAAQQSVSQKTKQKNKLQTSTKSPIVPKLKSNTQQKNSLLQLASLLKAQSSNQGSNNATQKRLDLLLK